MLSFQLTGIPLDTESFKELSRIFDVGYQYYFRPMKRRSVKRNRNLPEQYRMPLEPVAFIVEQDDVFGDERDWARGLVAKNPFYRPNSTLAERKPDWLPPHIFDSELLICDLRSWHLLTEPKPRYELWGCESARTADAVIVHPIAEWPDQEQGPTEEITPRRLAGRSDVSTRKSCGRGMPVADVAVARGHDGDSVTGEGFRRSAVAGPRCGGPRGWRSRAGTG